MRQSRADRNRRKFRRTQHPHRKSLPRGVEQFAVDPDLGLCLQTTLRGRIDKLSEKARLVRSRLNQLSAYLDGSRKSAPAAVVGVEGEDMDFLLAEILALRSILAHSSRPGSEATVAASIFSMPRA